MEKIYIEGLLLRTIIGIHPHEREEKQDIIVSLEIWADLKKAMEDDSIEDTIDYRALKKNIIKEVEKTNFYLIEALANFIGNLVLKEEKVLKVKVKVEKPGALRFAKTVGVEIFKEKN